MIGTVIVSHGAIAQEMLAAAQRIVGDVSAFEAVTLGWEEGLESAREKIGAAVARMDRGAGVLILADIFGSTPCNAALAHLSPGRVELVAGVNLPMVLRMGCRPEPGMSLDETAQWLEQKGRSSIRRAPETVVAVKLSACGEVGG